MSLNFNKFISFDDCRLPTPGLNWHRIQEYTLYLVLIQTVKIYKFYWHPGANSRGQLR